MHAGIDDVPAPGYGGAFAPGEPVLLQEGDAMAGMGYEGSERGATRTGTYHHHVAFGHAFPSFYRLQQDIQRTRASILRISHVLELLWGTKPRRGRYL
jgi:hypothetical protein